MKIAVYTIAKNEEQHVARWAESCKEADYRFILDTGSTDDTRQAAIDASVEVMSRQFDPWRFDHARNFSLACLPKDIDLCISLDMDEVLQPGWREALEQLPPTVTRPRYQYVWSWNPDGSEGLTYGGDKIHARHGYRWKHPVHEVLKPDGVETQPNLGVVDTVSAYVKSHQAFVLLLSAPNKVLSIVVFGLQQSTMELLNAID